VQLGTGGGCGSTGCWRGCTGHRFGSCPWCRSGSTGCWRGCTGHRFGVVPGAAAQGAGVPAGAKKRPADALDEDGAGVPLEALKYHFKYKHMYENLRKFKEFKYMQERQSSRPLPAEPESESE